MKVSSLLGRTAPLAPEFRRLICSCGTILHTLKHAHGRAWCSILTSMWSSTSTAHVCYNGIVSIVSIADAEYVEATGGQLQCDSTVRGDHPGASPFH